MLNGNVYHPTPVIPGPIALIDPNSTSKPHTQKKKKKKKGTQGSNQCMAN